MKPWIALATAILMVSAPFPCLGQEPNELTTALKEGEPAPFAGLLVPEGEYTRLMEARLEVRELQARLRASQRESTALEQMYLSKLKTAAAPLAWYETASFNRWFGFTLGVATAGLAVWGSSKLSR